MPSSVGLNFCFHRLVDIVLSRDSSKVAARERLVGVKSLPMLEEEGNFLISCNFLISWFFDFFYLWVTKILLEKRRVYTCEWWVKIHYQIKQPINSKEVRFFAFCCMMLFYRHKSNYFWLLYILPNHGHLNGGTGHSRGTD